MGRKPPSPCDGGLGRSASPHLPGLDLGPDGIGTVPCRWITDRMVAGASQGHVPPPLLMQRLCRAAGYYAGRRFASGEAERGADTAGTIGRVTSASDEPLSSHAEPSSAQVASFPRGAGNSRT